MISTFRQHPYFEKMSGPWIARGLAFFGALFALLRQWGFSKTHDSILDEGLYLLKGYLFATGQYRPFEDFGVWTNHMPLSFLIPGWSQVVLGPGLRSGRLYALGLNVLILIGLWLVSRRLSNRWVAAGILWLWALNSATLRIYSTATSQVLITAMMIWTLFFILGPERPAWQIATGSILAGLMLLTRLNMAPALPLIVLYVFWQHGARQGWAALLWMGATVMIGHLLYWPGILRMWAAWLPPSLSPFLAPFRPPAGQPAWSPSLNVLGRPLSFWFTVRYHFLALLALLATMLGWPTGDKGSSSRKSAVFLGTLFFVLLAAHAWASLGSHAQTDEALGSDYCIFCFPIYTAFFSITGFLLLALLLAHVSRSPAVTSWLAPAFVLLLTAGIGYGAHKTFGTALTHLRVPRLRALFSSGSLEPGIPLWDVLNTRFGLEIEAAKRILPAVLGLLVGLGILLLAGYLARRRPAGLTFGQFCMAILFVLGVVLAPGPQLSGGYLDYACPGNVIAAYESGGAYLNQLIPPEARIYWAGSLSPVPLLYLERPLLLPGQINQTYSLRLSGSDREHLRFGFWTESLAREWLAQSDFVLVSGRNDTGWLAAELGEGSAFHELPPAPPLAPCDPDSELRVFARTGAP